jgi:hypothetical protein
MVNRAPPRPLGIEHDLQHVGDSHLELGFRLPSHDRTCAACSRRSWMLPVSVTVAG